MIMGTMPKKPESAVVSMIGKGQSYGARLDIKSSAGFAQCRLTFIGYRLATIK